MTKITVSRLRMLKIYSEYLINADNMLLVCNHHRLGDPIVTSCQKLFPSIFGGKPPVKLIPLIKIAGQEIFCDVLGVNHITLDC